MAGRRSTGDILRVTQQKAAIRRLPGRLYDIGEVSSALDIPVNTLRNWRNEQFPQALPSHRMLLAGRWVSLYDEAAVRRLQSFKKRRKSRPKLWSTEETLARRRHYRRARALEARAGTLGGAESDDLWAQAAQIRSKLRQEAAQKRAQGPLEGQ